MFDPDPVEFLEDQRVGTQSASVQVTVTSDGTDPDPYTVSDVFLDGDDPDDFEIVSDSCSGTEVTQTTGCAVSLRFSPTAAGDRLALLVLDNAGGGFAFGAEVYGFAYDPPPIAASPAALTFAPVRRDGARGLANVLLTNEGDGNANMGAASIAGPDAAAFSVFNDGCNGRVLAPDASCTVRAAFRPSHDGSHGATLSVASDGSGAPHTVGLSGTGLPEANIRIEPGGLDFGLIGAPFGDVTREFTVRNIGDNTAHLVPAVSALEPLAGARITQNACAAELFAGGSCLVSVTVTPLGQGTLSGVVRVHGRRTNSTLATGTVSGQVGGDPSAFMRSSLTDQLTAATRAWRRSTRGALRRQGFRMSFAPPLGGTLILRISARVPGGSAAGNRLVARFYGGVGPETGERTLRARLTPAGRRLLRQRRVLRVTSSLRFEVADGRQWTVSRTVRLR